MGINIAEMCIYFYIIIEFCLLLQPCIEKKKNDILSFHISTMR